MRWNIAVAQVTRAPCTVLEQSAISQFHPASGVFSLIPTLPRPRIGRAASRGLDIGCQVSAACPPPPQAAVTLRVRTNACEPLARCPIALDRQTRGPWGAVTGDCSGCGVDEVGFQRCVAHPMGVVSDSLQSVPSAHSGPLARLLGYTDGTRESCRQEPTPRRVMLRSSAVVRKNPQNLRPLHRASAGTRDKREMPDETKKGPSRRMVTNQEQGEPWSSARYSLTRQKSRSTQRTADIPRWPRLGKQADRRRQVASSVRNWLYI